MIGFYILIGAISLVSWLVSRKLKSKFKTHPWAKKNADNLLKKEQCEIMIAEMQKNKPVMKNFKEYFEGVMKSEKFGKMSEKQLYPKTRLLKNRVNKMLFDNKL